MENLTNQLLILSETEKYYIIRQALYKGTTYYLCAQVTEDEQDFTDRFVFFERIDKDGQSLVKEVTDSKILETLSKNIKVDTQD